MLGRTTKCDLIAIQLGLQPAFVLLVFGGFTSRGGGSSKFVDPSHDTDFRAAALTNGQKPTTCAGDGNGRRPVCHSQRVLIPFCLDGFPPRWVVLSPHLKDATSIDFYLQWALMAPWEILRSTCTAIALAVSNATASATSNFKAKFVGKMHLDHPMHTSVLPLLMLLIPSGGSEP